MAAVQDWANAMGMICHEVPDDVFLERLSRIERALLDLVKERAGPAGPPTAEEVVQRLRETRVRLHDKIQGGEVPAEWVVFQKGVLRGLRKALTILSGVTYKDDIETGPTED